MLRLLSAYRAMILHQAQWHDTLSPEAYAAWEADRDEFETLAAAHLERYDGDVDYPAYNLTAAELGVQRADRDLAMAWIARGSAPAGGHLGRHRHGRLAHAPGPPARRRRRAGDVARRRPGRGVRASRRSACSRSTAGCCSASRRRCSSRPGRCRPRSCRGRTWPSSLGAWVVFVLVVRLLLRRRSPWPVIAAVGGVIVLRCIVTLFALSFYRPRRLLVRVLDRARLGAPLYIAVAFALFVWVFVAAGWALAVAGRRAAARPGWCSRPSAPGSPFRPPSSRVIGLETGTHGVERRDGSAALGPRAHPRHHDLPRHPGRHRVVRRRLRGRDRGGRRAAGSALRAGRSAAPSPRRKSPPT